MTRCMIRIGEKYLTRSDLATILLIKDNLGKRPIYFSWSDGGYPDTMLGLTPYLVSQGMVRRLYSAPVKADSNRIIYSQGMGFVNLPRTQQLLSQVYHPDAAARRRPAGWVDKPSDSILRLYYLVYGGYADLLMARGDSAAAAVPDSIANAVYRNLNP